MDSLQHLLASQFAIARHPANDSRLARIQETLDKIEPQDDRAVCKRRTQRPIGSTVFVTTRSENTFDTSILPDTVSCITPDPEWQTLEGHG